MPVFESRLAGYFPETDASRLNQALRHSLFPGGKRIRPMLCIAAYRACLGGKDKGEGRKDKVRNPNLSFILHPLSFSAEAILPVACALELIHTFSLIQDDLPSMDDDVERRGKPTLHVAFGEATAILASDALFARAFEMLAEAHTTPARRIRLVAEIARAVGKDGIVAGQLQDICSEMPNAKCQMSSAPTPNTRHLSSPQVLRHIHCLKTARLIAVSLKTGAIVAGATPKVIAALERAGTFLGMLFQITDDLLDTKSEDANPNDETLMTNSDFGSRPSHLRFPLTYPGLYGLDGARFRARRYRTHYENQLRSVEPRLSPSGFRDLLAVGEMVLDRTR